MDLLVYALPISFIAVIFALNFAPAYRRAQLLLALLALLYVTLISSFRGDVGFDWPTYRYLFDGLIRLNFPSAYNSATLSGFEPGFRALLALLISSSSNEQSLLLLTSTFLSCSVLLLLTTVNRSHRAFALGSWLLIALFPIYFGQVRQALALSFAFLGIYALRKLGSLTFCFFVVSLGCLFHLSCLIYLLIISTAGLHRFCNFLGKNSYAWGLLAILITSFNINAISIFGFMSGKVLVYSLTTTSVRNPFLSYALITLMAYGCWLSSVYIGDRLLRSIVISSLFYTVISMVLFSGTYAIFSRTFSFSSFYLGCISSFSSLSLLKRPVLFSLAVCATLLSYAFLQLIYYWDQFIPYKYSYDF